MSLIAKIVVHRDIVLRFGIGNKSLRLHLTKNNVFINNVHRSTIKDFLLVQKI